MLFFVFWMLLYCFLILKVANFQFNENQLYYENKTISLPKEVLKLFLEENKKLLLEIKKTVITELYKDRT